ncbi:hypothetical protein E2C01_086343 [Portunus trituberculatus]|uniref:Uncharacterized protein n=1 Tax=Portunus trituberculatus TaxID=210409 RepID=A0A5B7JB92_PORTR|nr:hypothetical protein [Portunus trituberculatus]
MHPFVSPCRTMPPRADMKTQQAHHYSVRSVTLLHYGRGATRDTLPLIPKRVRAPVTVSHHCCRKTPATEPLFWLGHRYPRSSSRSSERNIQ